MNRINPKALVIGTLLVLALSVVAGVALVSVQGVLLAMEGQSEEQILQALTEITDDEVYLLWSVLLGGLACVLGGYVTARVAKAFPYFNGLAVGVLSTVVGAVFWDDLPLWLVLVDIVVTPVCCVLGAHLAVVRATAAAGRTD